MAETKSIITRIKNKVDNISAWLGSDGILLDGEIALVRVPTGEEYTNPVTGKTEPVVELLMKVGDGVHKFYDSENPGSSLPWLSAKASDVYNWAKKANPDWDDFDLDDLIDKIPVIPGDKLGLTVIVAGDGNAVTDASYNETTKTITLTKGATFALDGHSHELPEHTHPNDHTHKDGKGTKVTGTSDKAIDLNVEFKTDLVEKSGKKYLQLVDADDKTVVAEFDTTAFIKDGMIKSVELKTSGEGESYPAADGPYLVFTWNIDNAINTDADTAVDVLWVPVKNLVDVYTAQKNATEVQVAIDNNVISATLTDAVKTELNKAHEHANKALLDSYDQTNANIKAAVDQKHTHNFADEAALNGITSAKVAAWDNAEQNAKTEAANLATVALAEAEKYADSLADNYATAAQGALADTALQEVVANDTEEKPSGLKVTDKNKIEIDDTLTWIFDCGGADL